MQDVTTSILPVGAVTSVGIRSCANVSDRRLNVFPCTFVCINKVELCQNPIILRGSHVYKSLAPLEPKLQLLVEIWELVSKLSNESHLELAY